MSSIAEGLNPIFPLCVGHGSHHLTLTLTLTNVRFKWKYINLWKNYNWP